nr:immunoglobulin heavy chain junction region [Macaca mulatta]MOW98441.1 immunoglobulin heavy chain junction region [Macaca mulatta]MOW98864.1 immunoglobulin heavy chain junction region [Macaca mulatta]MOX00700.1 immunoglobulin heavy chain junction region [Macaca mulatta]MOX00910.1 immunoglobulin heavy chain junction region [Macaca mulatta]
CARNGYSNFYFGLDSW